VAAAAACMLVLSNSSPYSSIAGRHKLDASILVGLAQVGTAWRPDKLKEMTYTQFWHLVQQRQIDKVRRLRDAACGRLFDPCTCDAGRLCWSWLAIRMGCGGLQVKYTNDTRSLWVTTKDTAPGGRRTEKVETTSNHQSETHLSCV
jgi:hypothetical protein